MKIGDTVTYPHCTQRGNSIGFFAREAKIINIMPNNVVVKYRGKLVNLRPDRVRLKGQRTELTEMIMRDFK